jgi:hypothetical protein
MRFGAAAVVRNGLAARTGLEGSRVLPVRRWCSRVRPLAVHGARTLALTGTLLGIVVLAFVQYHREQVRAGRPVSDRGAAGVPAPSPGADAAGRIPRSWGVLIPPIPGEPGTPSWPQIGIREPAELAAPGGNEAGPAGIEPGTHRESNGSPVSVPGAAAVLAGALPAVLVVRSNRRRRDGTGCVSPQLRSLEEDAADRPSSAGIDPVQDVVDGVRPVAEGEQPDRLPACSSPTAPAASPCGEGVGEIPGGSPGLSPRGRAFADAVPPPERRTRAELSSRVVLFSATSWSR